MDPKELVKLVQQESRSPETRKFRLFADADFIVELRYLPRAEVTAMHRRNQITNYQAAKRGEEQFDEEGLRSDLSQKVIHGWSGLTPDVFRRMIFLSEKGYARIAKEKEIPYSREIAELLLREGKVDGTVFDMLILGIVANPENFANGRLGDEVKNLPSAPDTGQTPNA